MKDPHLRQFYRDKSSVEGCVPRSEDEKERCEHDEEAQAPQWMPSGPVCQKI